MKAFDLRKLFIVFCCAVGAVACCFYGVTAERTWKGTILILVAVLLCFIGFMAWYDLFDEFDR